MNDAKKALSISLAPLLRERGYAKKALTWHSVGADTVRVFNVQQSQWGVQFYINLAIYLRPLGALTRPALSDCHIHIRLEAVVPDPTVLHPLLDFEHGPHETKADQLAAFVAEYGLPWLDAWSDLRVVEARLRASTAFICPIKRSVYDYFHLPLPT